VPVCTSTFAKTSIFSRIINDFHILLSILHPLLWNYAQSNMDHCQLQLIKFDICSHQTAIYRKAVLTTTFSLERYHCNVPKYGMLDAIFTWHSYFYIHILLAQIQNLENKTKKHKTGQFHSQDYKNEV
jgi:hypothetical protein